ncbi:MAG: FAD-dependent oxidoreductase [Bradymonadaceae bacterium]
MTEGRNIYDVVVVGAGVVGSAAAHVLAEQGASCLLLEADPDAVRRYAGEWMHPTVTRLMDEFGLEIPDAASDHPAGEGFVVHPDDGTEPIELPYPTDRQGFCCSHYELSTSVRAQAADHGAVTYRPYARAVDVDPEGRVRFHLSEENLDREVAADLVVGAGGRSSICRQSIGEDTPRELVTYMAALGLNEVELPREGYGHIFTGGPGVALGYRHAPDEVRLCLDVPSERRDLKNDPQALYEAFEEALPEQLRGPVRDELDRENLRWSATFFQPRTERGEERVALVGDAIGLCHPLCAAGVAVGFLDIALLAEAYEEGNLESYRERGAAETRVPELMSCVIYKLLGTTEDTSALRRALYRTWRRDPAERNRTMQILTGAARDPGTFVASFANVGAQALVDSGRETLRDGGMADLVSGAEGFGEWAQWPLAAALPDTVAERFRATSSVDSFF